MDDLEGFGLWFI